MPEDTPAPAVVRCKAKPREYKDGEDFNLYLNHFNRVAAANQWTDAIKLVQLETTLKGAAQREFDVFIDETPEITWAAMTEKLKRELVPSTQKSLDIFGQMRLDGRSPREFYASLIRQSKIAHGIMDDDARHIVVRAQMLMVLPRKLRMDASIQDDLTTLDKEAFLKLLTRVYEAEIKEESEEQPYEPVVGQVILGKQNTMESRIQKLEEDEASRGRDMAELKSLMKDIFREVRQERKQPNWSMGDITCYNCQQKGHMARDCKNQKICRGCKEEGHTYSVCPKKPKNG